MVWEGCGGDRPFGQERGICSILCPLPSGGVGFPPARREEEAARAKAVGGGETLAEDAIALEDSAPIGPLSGADVRGTRGGQLMAMTQGVYITILGMAVLSSFAA